MKHLTKFLLHVGDQDKSYAFMLRGQKLAEVSHIRQIGLYRERRLTWSVFRTHINRIILVLMQRDLDTDLWKCCTWKYDSISDLLRVIANEVGKNINSPLIDLRCQLVAKSCFETPADIEGLPVFSDPIQPDS